MDRDRLRSLADCMSVAQDKDNVVSLALGERKFSRFTESQMMCMGIIELREGGFLRSCGIVAAVGLIETRYGLYETRLALYHLEKMRAMFIERRPVKYPDGDRADRRCHCRHDQEQQKNSVMVAFRYAR